MALFLTVLEITAPVFLLAALGFTWVRMGWDYPVSFVTRLSMTIAVPALVFSTLMKTELSPEALSEMALAAAIVYPLLTVVFAGVVRLLRIDSRTYLAPLVFANTGNLGLPLALFAYGETGLGLAIVVFAVMAIYNFTYGLWLVAGRGLGLQVLREPMLIASLLGALFLWQGWTLPLALDRAVGLVGQIAIPLMLLTLGVAVGRLTPAGLPRALGLSIIKLVICAGAGVALGRALGLTDAAFGVLVLQLITPVAVTAYLLAEKYGTDSEAVAGLVVVSTLLSVVALPVALAFLL